MKKFALSLVLTLAAGVALAAGLSAVVTITPPTVNTDGTAITLPLTCNIYQGATGAEIQTQTAQSCTTPITVTSGLTAGATVCFAATAVAGGQESARSAEACKTFPASVPAAPTVTLK